MKRKNVLRIIIAIIMGISMVSIPKSPINKVEASATTIKIENENKPEAMKIGTSFSIKGNISAGKQITSVTAGIYDVNEKEKQKKTVSPNAFNYDVSQLAKYIKFENLSAGIYRYRLVAQNVEGTETLVSKVFVIYTDGKTIANGKYRMKTMLDQNYVMAVDGNSTEDKANIMVWYDEPSNQCMTWEFTYQGSGYYSIKNAGTGKMVDVDNAGTTDQTNVHQYNDNGTIAQRWQVLPDGTGNYYLVPKVNLGLCLDIYNGEAKNNQNIQIWTANMTPAQRWNLYYLGQKNQTIQASSKTITYKSKNVSLNAKTTGNGKLSYSSSNKNIVTVDSNGIVTGKGYGTATISIKASETKQYKKASKNVTVTVIPRKMNMKSASSSKKKHITISWGKDTSVTGYHLYVSLDKNFKNNTFERWFKAKTTSMNTGGMKSKRTYYVKIRAYKTVGKKKLYGAWSSTKKVKIK